MPLDALMVSLAVVGVFVAFAAVLLWADLQTKPSNLQSDTSGHNRRNS